MIDCKGGGNYWLLNNDQFDNNIHKPYNKFIKIAHYQTTGMFC